MKINQHYQSFNSESMKKLRIIIFLTILIVLSFSKTFAQQDFKTAYQQRVIELTLKYFKILYGYNKQLTMYDKMQLEILTNDGEASSFIVGIGMMNYASNHSEAETKKLIEQIKYDYKQAEKLKIDVDFKREKEAKEKKELEAYEKTDIGNIKNKIKLAFEQWNQKGEFEKEADYAIRLKSQSQIAFDSICTDKIKDRIKHLDSYKWEKELSVYNSENEYFTVTFKVNNIAWQSKTDIPITKAQSFKDDWLDLRFYIDDYDWRFVNNNLCPIFVSLGTYNEKSMYKFPVSLQNQSEIIYVFEDLKIENPFLNGYTYKFSKAKEIANQQLREKQRLDSLELVTFNQRLDSIFNDLNRKLLQNSYNLDQITLKDYNKITNGEERVKSFNSSVYSMKNEYERLNNSFEYQHRHEYSENGSDVFSNENEFESFYIKGKDIYKSEVEKRKVLRSLAVSSKIIETIDFQKEAKENIGSALLSSYTGTYTNYEEINKIRRDVLNTIKSNQNKPYYSQIIDFVVETNKDLNKEWIKNGQYFESKVEFYNSFISTDYKSILKNNKQKSKN